MIKDGEINVLYIDKTKYQIYRYLPGLNLDCVQHAQAQDNNYGRSHILLFEKLCKHIPPCLADAVILTCYSLSASMGLRLSVETTNIPVRRSTAILCISY